VALCLKIRNQRFVKSVKSVSLPMIPPDDAGRIQSQSSRRDTLLTGETNSIAVEDDFDSAGIRNGQLHSGYVRNAVCSAGAKYAIDKGVIAASLHGDPDRPVQTQHHPRIAVFQAVAHPQRQRWSEL
jgi:phage tail sheath gpL-like